MTIHNKLLTFLEKQLGTSKKYTGKNIILFINFLKCKFVIIKETGEIIIE